MTELTVPKPEATPFSILDVPRILFEELSELLGIGAEGRIDRFDGVFQMRALNPEHRLTGYACAIGYEKFSSDGPSTLHLWPGVPKPDDKYMVYELRPILRITGRRVSAGLWTATNGNLMTEEVKADFDHSYGLNLGLGGTRLIAMILVRSSQLARDPTCVTRKFWDGQTELDD